MNFPGYSGRLDNQSNENLTNLWIEVYKTTRTFINVFCSKAIARSVSVVSGKLCRLYTLQRESQTKKTSNFPLHIQPRNEIFFVFLLGRLKENLFTCSSFDFWHTSQFSENHPREIHLQLIHSDYRCLSYPRYMPLRLELQILLRHGKTKNEPQTKIYSSPVSMYYSFPMSLSCWMTMLTALFLSNLSLILHWQTEGYYLGCQNKLRIPLFGKVKAKLPLYLINKALGPEEMWESQLVMTSALRGSS
jgi:hypothetical protein